MSTPMRNGTLINLETQAVAARARHLRTSSDMPTHWIGLGGAGDAIAVEVTRMLEAKGMKGERGINLQRHPPA